MQADGFRFISPTPPGNPQQEGIFNPTLTPVVRICRLSRDEGSCIADVAEFVTGPDGPITVDTQNEQYQVSWSGLNQLKNEYPNNRYYRITVRSSLSADAETWGTVDVQLTDGAGTGVNVSGNTLPIKFWVSFELTCTDECLVFTVVQGVGGRFILQQNDPNVPAGSVGINFEPTFCASAECDDSGERLTVVVERYRGPERCIPVPAGVDALEYEVCVRVFSIPASVALVPEAVLLGVCLDERVFPLVSNEGLVRFKKVSENAGVADPNTVVDLEPRAIAFMTCDDEVLAQNDGAGTSSGVLGRLASRAGQVLSSAARYFAPAPAHAWRRRIHVPFGVSPVSLSRFGVVLPVAAQFDRDFGVGFSTGPVSPQPRVRVVGVYTDAEWNILSTSTVGVPAVQVEFTAAADDGTVDPSIVETNEGGYASANWTLGPIASNPQHLRARVGAPTRSASAFGAFPNNENTVACSSGSAGCYWWAEHTFRATAREYAVFFLAPLGHNPGGLTNEQNVSPTLRVCGPFADPGTALDLSVCPVASGETIANPVLKQNVWETSWKTNRNTINNALYRIDVRVGTNVTGAFLVRRGGGGGSDPDGTYQFQTGSQLPIKFVLVAQP